MKPTRRIRTVALLLIIVATQAFGQSGLPTYFSQSDMSFVPPGAMRFGLYGYLNPAMLSSLHQPDMMFTFRDNHRSLDDIKRWGLFCGSPHFGFGMIHHTANNNITVTDYRHSISIGDESLSLGLSYGWSSGNTHVLERPRSFTFGTLIRPNRFVSLGLAGTMATKGGRREGFADLALRPLGNELVTLFGDFALQDYEKLDQGAWSVGVVVEALPGVRLHGRYFDDERYSLGAQLSFGNGGVSSLSDYESGGNLSHTMYSIRIGAADRTLLRNLDKNRNYLKLNLFGIIKHQRYRFFDTGMTLARTLADIEAARRDDSVAGIAINISGIKGNPSMIWEIRHKLMDFRSSGKHVVIYGDNLQEWSYYLASVADCVVLDPVGSVFLKGVVLGRTYIKGTLKKLGIGVDEWRLFKYKSAFESFSRDHMSDGDREQLQELTDDFYDILREDICSSRRITHAEFDGWVNDHTFFLPTDALEKGLVDTLGRWDDIEKLVARFEGRRKRLIASRDLAAYQLPHDDRWGENPKIALIYALGICAMDQGIHARTLIKDVQRVTRDPDIKAVVLRIDSPGGDALASDIIAEAVRKCKKRKPVIISQGFVAASGGYWLSMYGDEIIAAPTTITGSIGVIGGWFYDDGLKQELGMSTDLVKAGDHADLGFGFRLPFLGLGLPDRNLDEDERTRAETAIRSLYDSFLAKVAEGRQMDIEEVAAVAQGRVWTGMDAHEHGLVDIIGGLDTAIQHAKKRAGIALDQDITIIELPNKGLFNPRVLGKSPLEFLGLDVQPEIPVGDPLWEHIRFRLEHNGRPLPLLPLDEIGYVFLH